MESATQSASVSKFAAAFVKAQREMKHAVKDKNNPHFRSSYADLAAVMDACREALNANGIAVIQRGAPSTEGKLALETILMHESGEWVSGVGELSLGRGDGPQAYGSALTYARRYFLAAMVGVCPEDDDGEAAHGRGPQAQQQTNTPRTTQPPKKPAATSAAKPDSTQPPGDNEIWSRTMGNLLKERGLRGARLKQAVEMIIADYGVARLADVPADQWAQVEASIRAGEFDQPAQAAA